MWRSNALACSAGEFQACSACTLNLIDFTSILVTSERMTQSNSCEKFVMCWYTTASGLLFFLCSLIPVLIARLVSPTYAAGHDLHANFVTWWIFTTLLSRFGERISIMKSPLLVARKRILHLSDQGHSYSCIIYLFLLVFFFFMREKIMRRT